MSHHEGQAQESPKHHVPAALKEGHQDDVSVGPPHLPHEEARSLHAQEDPNVHPEPAPRCPSTYLNIFLVCFQTVIQNHFHCNMYCKSQVRMSYFSLLHFFLF
jgi:hypothetical protein